MASGNSREKLGRTGRSARHRMVVRTESLRIPNWHDTGSTSARSVGEVALIWDTISHYSPVLIAPLAISSRRRIQKKRAHCRTRGEETTSEGNAMRKRVLTAIAVAALIGMTTSAASPQQDIRWGTPPVGTAGHKAMVTLANLLNKEMPNYRISVLPTAGAIATVKGFATKELDGYYGSDVAFHELASDSGRFKGFKERVQRQPIQSFWSNTIEVGLAVHVRNKDKIRKWGDLAGKRMFTGPLPFDTRAQTERALNGLGVKFNYVQVDLATVGSLLESGAIDAMSIYTGSESSPPPWLSEASLAADWAALNPNADEIAEFKKKGLSVVEVSSKVFNRDVHADKVVEL